ncbi:MAG: hypothetical protein ACRCYY_21540 [Trueperaceae bacterium]
MNLTAREIYNQIAPKLSLTERLRLASLLLENLNQQNISVINDSSTWTEEDIEDITRLSIDYAHQSYPEGK